MDVALAGKQEAKKSDRSTAGQDSGMAAHRAHGRAAGVPRFANRATPSTSDTRPQPGLQAKLVIGQPGDVFEQEADRVAHMVVTDRPYEDEPNSLERHFRPQDSPPAALGIHPTVGIPSIQKACSACAETLGEQETRREREPATPLFLQRMCVECEEQVREQDPGNSSSSSASAGHGVCPECESESEVFLQTKEGSGSGFQPDVVAAAVHSPGSGSPIPPSVRRRIEPTLRFDTSDIRVHDDENARAATTALHAKAFTHQRDIWLGPGQSAHDVGLMAHESSHVMQQTGVGSRIPSRHIVSPSVNRTTESSSGSYGLDWAPSIQLNEDDYSEETKTEFEQRVFAKAKRRLEQNEEHLAQWREFIISEFDATALAAQVQAGEALELYQEAESRGRSWAFEEWCGMRRPHLRGVRERIARGFINSGCQQCHEENIAWSRDFDLLYERGLEDFSSFGRRARCCHSVPPIRKLTASVKLPVVPSGCLR